GVTGDAAGMGMVASVLIGGVGAKALQRSLLGASSGFWHSVPGRWLIGRVAGGAVFLLLLLPMKYAVNLFFVHMIADTYAREGAAAALKLSEIYNGLGWPIAAWMVWCLHTRAKIFIGKSTRPFRRWYRT